MLKFLKNIFLILILISSSIAMAQNKFIIPPAIETYINTLRPHPVAKIRVAAFDKLVLELENIPFQSLEKAYKNSDLDAKTLSIIQKNSHGLFDLPTLKNMDEVHSGYSLGLSSASGQYQMLSERFSLSDWEEAYTNLKIDWKKLKNHTEIFLDRITKTKKPIVFFLPKQIITYPKESITKNELLWLLAHPERLKNTYFILGGYELVTPKMQELRVTAGISEDMFRALFMRALGHGPSSYEANLE